MLSFYPVVPFKILCIFMYFSGRTEVQSVQYGKEKANKDRVFAR